MLSKEDLSDRFCFPAYSSESSNNGIIGYTNSPEFICDEKNPVFVIFGDHTRSFNIATKSFSVLDNVKVLLSNIHDINCLLWIITAWQKQIPNLGYARHWKIAKDCIIQLPTKNGEIDFDFMTTFISELEEECISELEEECISELEAYLQITGLDNYELTEEEQKILDEYEHLDWGEYQIKEIFDICSYKKRFDANKVKITENIGHPYIVRMGNNNGCKGYIEAEEQFLNEGNTISFGQDTATMYYQEKPYFTGDKIKVLHSKIDGFGKLNAQFFLTAMGKSFSSYSWGASRFNVESLKKETINLPIKDNKIDILTMNLLISAISKLVIKDVVLYKNKKIKLTKKIIDKNTN